MENFGEKKILVAFFTRPGFNYTSSGIKNIAVGNTEVVAKKIAQKLNADLFKIDPVNPYPLGYQETVDLAGVELNKNARPKIKNHLNNYESYDIIILGFPNWWGTMPMPVFTFLEECKGFVGKTIMPFCTHEGSAMGNSERDIKKACPYANVKPGAPIYGSSAANSDKEIHRWLTKM